jgi:hypothetical protein
MISFWVCFPLLMSSAPQGLFDDGCQGRAFFQEGVVAENGIDFDELARPVQARRQACMSLNGTS